MQNKLHDTIYKNAKLRAQIFDKVFEQKDTTRGTSENTKFAKQSILGIPPSSSRPKLYVITPLPKSMAIPKVGETNALSNQVTLNSVPSSQQLKVMENDNVIAHGMFRIDPRKTSRKDNFVPNKPTKASVRTNPITVSQPRVIIKKAINFDSNCFSSIGVDIATKTRRPQPRSNTKNDRVPPTSKSSRIMNKEVKVEDHPRNLLLSKNKKHMSSECNNIKLAIRNDKSKIVCAMCKQCLIFANHDDYVLNYVNGMNSRRKKQKVNVPNIVNQTKHKAQIWKPKNVGPKERLASPKPSKPRMHLRWSPIGKKFDHKGKIIASSDSNGDNACYPNMFMVHRLGLFQAYDRESKASHQLRLEVLWNRRLGFITLRAWVTTFVPRWAIYESELENDHEDIRKLGAKGDIGFFIGYSTNSCAYRTLTTSTTTADTAPTPTNSFSQATSIPSTSQNVDELKTQQQHGQPHPATIADNVLNAMFYDNTFVNPFATPSTSAAGSSSLQYVDPSNMHTFYQPYPHEYQWTKDHPLKQVIGEPSRPVLTRNQLRTDGDMCMYALTVSTMEPKNVNEAMTDPAWIESMQEELL
ncbi:hypothetical protein Tco_0217699 [Tanacetum coccineum]